MLGFSFLSVGGGNPFSALPKKPPRALHGARIREAQNKPQGLFCVHAHPASVPDGNSIPPEFKLQSKTPPDKAGWRLTLMVEPASLERPLESRASKGLWQIGATICPQIYPP